jgi:hypothetical protein
MSGYVVFETRLYLLPQWTTTAATPRLANRACALIHKLTRILQAGKFQEQRRMMVPRM